MKKIFCRNLWLAALVGLTCFGPRPLFAQNDDNPVLPPEAPEAPAPDTKPPADNVPGKPTVINRAKNNSHRKVEFKKTFDNLDAKDRRGPTVAFGKTAVVKSDQIAEALVAIGGSAVAEGNVRNSAVAIGGDVTIDNAEVGDAAVAVLGNVKVNAGSIVHGDVVSVGGKVEVAEGAKVEGKIQEVDFGLGALNLNWLKQWIAHCGIKLRLLALTGGVSWAWAVAAAFFLFYLFLALIAARPVEVCLAELTRRPATTFLMGLMLQLLIPVIFVILAVTGIGLVLIPFLLAAFLFAALLGKVVFLEYLGKAVGGALNREKVIKPLYALVLGGIAITLFYLVPVFGLIAFSVSSIWGLGVVITAAFGSWRRESFSHPATQPTPSFAAPAAPATAFETNQSFPSGSPETPPAPPIPPLVSTAFVAPEAFTFPRATFWARMAAGLVDLILVGILAGFIHRTPFGILVFLGYFVGMWKWKETTIGGIIFNLKIVRLDGKPLTLPVALVRGLAAAFSAVVLFLGVLWMIWDREKQTWHDKIAGTIVVRLPRSGPLLQS